MPYTQDPSVPSRAVDAAMDRDIEDVRPAPSIMAQIQRLGEATAAGPLAAAASDRSSSQQLMAALAGGLSAAERASLTEAHRAADRNNWLAAFSLAARSGNEIGRRTLQWRYVLDEDGAASFADIAAFLDGNAGWPRRDALLRRAETAMPPTFTPQEVIGWYERHPPLGRDGLVRYGEALIALGSKIEGQSLIARAWIDHAFTTANELAFLQAHGALLRSEDHQLRFERLLGGNALVDAQRQAARLSQHERPVAAARIALRRNPANASKAAPAPGQSIAADPRYRFEVARALRGQGKDEQAWEALRHVPAGTAVDPAGHWAERHIMARAALRARRFDTAYQLAADHPPLTGAAFADAEFLAGWIALRFLDLPETARGHFAALSAAVNLPISKARGHYWLGRAEEALGNIRAAQASYARAAEYPATFYGQIALAQIKAAASFDLAAAPIGRAAIAALEQDERVTAMHILEAAGQRALMRIFAVHLAGEMDDADRLHLLADALHRMGDTVGSLRVAKTAGYKNILLFPYASPVLDRRQLSFAGGVESALIHGIVRQESEFDAGAVSRAGARGLMQLMPATAEQMARSLKTTYRKESLSDPAFNVRLGSAYLAQMLKRWNGSYLLAIAAYNAGPGNVERWVHSNGDPRDPNVDSIDWIESIPFAETRNYVHRVLESTQIYRSRLAAGSMLGILADLDRGGVAPPVVAQEEMESSVPQ
jgi:soluble lytic murein transglycosylase